MSIYPYRYGGLLYVTEVYTQLYGYIVVYSIYQVC
jgi:hypothetical protein